MPSSSHTYLKSIGFSLTKTCQCGGSIAETWQRAGPIIIVELRPTKGTFKIRTASPRISGSLEALQPQLEAFLKKLSPSLVSGRFKLPAGPHMPIKVGLTKI